MLYYKLIKFQSQYVQFEFTKYNTCLQSTCKNYWLLYETTLDVLDLLWNKRIVNYLKCKRIGSKFLKCVDLQVKILQILN